jgi:glycyl-tRNA synthetase (class II)
MAKVEFDNKQSSGRRYDSADNVSKHAGMAKVEFDNKQSSGRRYDSADNVSKHAGMAKVEFDNKQSSGRRYDSADNVSKHDSISISKPSSDLRQQSNEGRPREYADVYRFPWEKTIR